MKAVLRIMVFGVFTVSLLSSCKVYRNVENLYPRVPKDIQNGAFVQESVSKLKEGEKILVVLKSGEEHHLFYKQMNGEHLIGTLWRKGKTNAGAGQQLEIPLVDVDKLYVNRVSAGVTIPVLLVGVFCGGVWRLLGFVCFKWWDSSRRRSIAIRKQPPEFQVAVLYRYVSD